MRQKVEIRPIRIDDLRALFLTGKERFGGASAGSALSWNEKNLAEIIAGNLEISLVALQKKTIVGFIIAALENGGVNAQTASIQWLWARENEESGVAADLLQAFQQNLTDKNINKIRTSVPASKAQLIKLYHKFGFTETEHVLTMENFLPKNKKPEAHAED